MCSILISPTVCQFVCSQCHNINTDHHINGKWSVFISQFSSFGEKLFPNPFILIHQVLSDVDMEFTYSLHNTAGGCLHRCVYKNNKSSYIFLGERWSSRVQQTEAGSDVLTPPWRSHNFPENTPTSVSALITKLSRRLHQCLLRMTPLFHLEIFFFFCICRGSEVSSPPPTHMQWFTHVNSWILY